MQSPMRSTSFARFLFQYRKRYGLHAILSFHTGIRSLRVSIPQAVWIACNFQFPRVSYNAATFQYRKRYGLHAIIGHAPSNEHRSVSIPQAVWIACNFLFLKGSDQMNTVSIPQAVWIACNLDEWYPLLPTERVSIPQAVWIACNFRARLSQKQKLCFNTASGMDCMQFIFVSEGEIDHEFQYRKRYGLHAMPAVFLTMQSLLVSIPQAVWIACNLIKLFKANQKASFQYRKRYGLHAILSPGSLGNSEPRSRFSDTDPLFAFFLKVRGTFLSRKVLRKGLEASHSKGTFVHERNLILMAFSLDFRASLEQSIS